MKKIVKRSRQKSRRAGLKTELARAAKAHRHLHEQVEAAEKYHARGGLASDTLARLKRQKLAAKDQYEQLKRALEEVHTVAEEDIQLPEGTSGADPEPQPDDFDGGSTVEQRAA